MVSLIVNSSNFLAIIYQMGKMLEAENLGVLGAVNPPPFNLINFWIWGYCK